MNNETVFCLRGKKVYAQDGALSACGKKVGVVKNNVYDFIEDRVDKDCASWDFQWEVFKDLHVKAKAYYPGLEEENFLKHFGLTAREVSGMRVLDAGAGTGRNAQMLAKFAAAVYAVDGSKSIHHHAPRGPERVTWVRSPLQELPFPDGYFDVILCDGVIPHVSKVSNVLQEFYRLLAEGGMLLVSYSEAPRGLFNAHAVVKLYRLITTRLAYSTVLKFSKKLSSFYATLTVRRVPAALKAVLLAGIPDKSTFDQWRICYTFDRLAARNWNFYPRSRFRRYLGDCGFSIARETDYRVSFVCKRSP